MAREVKKVISSATLEDAQTAMAVVAKCNSSIKKIESQMELEKQKIDDKYRDQVDNLKKEKEEPMEVLEVFAKKDCKNWDGKSYDLAHGTIGFRTATPSLTKKKGFTWEGIVALLKIHFPTLVRLKEEPNKEAIIALRDDKSFTKLQEKCMVDVEQPETFFIKTKEEQLVEG